jgi:hypothetical protein
VKGKYFMTGETIILITAIALCVLAAVAYIHKDDGAAKDYKEASSQVTASVTRLRDEMISINESVRLSQEKTNKELEVITKVTGDMLNDLQLRVKELENKKPLSQLHDLNLRFAQPLQVSVIYREAKKKSKPLIPTNEVKIERRHNFETRKVPLMDRAGLFKMEDDK